MYRKGRNGKKISKMYPESLENRSYGRGKINTKKIKQVFRVYMDVAPRFLHCSEFQINFEGESRETSLDEMCKSVLEHQN
jgi:hypothetical protein